MKEIRLPHQWEPRPYQKPLWEYLSRGGDRALTCWHRRSGKDDVYLHHTACAAHERVGNYWYMLPEYAQARKSMWDAINPRTGRRRIDDAFPKEVRKTVRENEMNIVFQNGSTFQLVGSDNFNALVGSPPVGLVFSEAALSNPSAWAYLQPILEENGGWVGFNSTPRGNNHFKNLYDYACTSDRWFSQILTNDQTKVFTNSQLEEILASLQAVHGEAFGRALWLQEYFCSFDAAIPGSIWGDCIEKLDAAGSIGDVPFEPIYPVYTGWDLGRTDDTVIWFYQVAMGTLRVIDYHASNMKDVEFYAELLAEKKRDRGFVYGTHWLPHDARPRTLAAGGKSILQQLNDLNDKKNGDLGRFAIAPRLDREEGIQAARATFKVSWFDSTRCADGIEALRHYHRTWDETKQTFSTEPVHDWCLTGDTKVLTRSGTHPIMDLPNTGEVLTSCGWKRYINPRITRRNAPLVEVAFADGLTVRCTPDHPFLTDSGWKFAEFLTPNSLIQSSLTRSRSISMAVYTVRGLVKRILLGAVKGFIAMSGNPHSGLYPMGVTYTTLMGMRETTFSITSNVSTAQSIYRVQINPAKSATRPEALLLDGTDQMLDGCGTAGTQKVLNHGQNGSVLRRIAFTAKRYFLELIEKVGIARNIAARPARHLRIESVRKLDENEDVWCLTVPGIEEFSLSNGAIVHNSSHSADAWRMVALTWKTSKLSPDAPDTTISDLLGASIGAQTFGELKKNHLARAADRRQNA